MSGAGDTIRSAMSGNSGNSVDFAPVRTLDDFVLSAARFQIPPYRDLEKWNNRILSNMLYYQTNYFILIICFFLFVGIIHPREIAMGILAIGVVLGVAYYATTQVPQAVDFKRDHPFISLALVLLTGYMLVAALSSIVVVAFGFAFPTLLMFLHASTRLRSMKNKVSGTLEAVGFKKTPMGLFFRALGIEVDRVPFTF